MWRFLAMRVEKSLLDIVEKREGDPPLLVLVVVAHAEVQYPIVAEVVEDVLVVDEDTLPSLPQSIFANKSRVIVGKLPLVNVNSLSTVLPRATRL